MNMLFGRCKKFEVNTAESTYKVHYLGNVMTSLLKGAQFPASPSKETYKTQQMNNSSSSSSNNSEESEDSDEEVPFTPAVLNSVDKSVKILWENHIKHNGHAGLKMTLTLTQGGLRVDTKDHGLTEYYGHRIHAIQAHHLHPKLFIWVYQHVGKNLKTEIRCHAALCVRARDALDIQRLLTVRIHDTFNEYKREKRRQQNSRLCNTKNGGLLGCKKRNLMRITRNYKPPVQHGMCSAPKLDDVVEEDEMEEEETESTKPTPTSVYDEEEFVDEYLENIESDLGEEEDDDYFYNPNISLVNEKYDNRALMLTQQLTLSSSSASDDSVTSSTTATTMSLSQIEQTPTPTASSFNSSNAEDSGIEEIKKLKKRTLAANENITASEKSFTEVSYEFLSDLSKINISEHFNNRNQNNKCKLNYSKSFSKHNHSAYNNSKDSKAHQIPPTTNSFNPFRRSSISKSFSAFTTRLKQQALLSRELSMKKKTQKPNFINESISMVNKISDQSQFELTRATCESVSRTSSPTLSSCSYSSNSSIQQQQIIINTTKNEDSKLIDLMKNSNIISL